MSGDGDGTSYVGTTETERLRTRGQKHSLASLVIHLPIEASQLRWSRMLI